MESPVNYEVGKYYGEETGGNTMIGNAVPLQVGQALARAVREATG